MSDHTRTFQLEQAYVSNTAPGAGVQILAQSAGLRRELIDECLRVARLTAPPLRPDIPAISMPFSFGIFRGETVDYVIARAGRDPEAKYTIVHYLLLPATALRWLGGNVLRLTDLAGLPMLPGDQSLLNYTFEQAEPPSYDTQNETLLTLLRYTKNNTKTVAGLLGALVQGMGVGVLNAPPSLEDRLTFIQGLLMLLPIPARVAITFATSVVDAAQTRAQVKFFDTPSLPGNHLVFDWQAKKLNGTPPEDVYSKFIVAQLKLDTSLVVEQTEKLARTAVWRAMRKDDLAEALAWISRRASLDSAIENNQPADRELVANVLREDPTLPDDLRLVYARHLITFSLSLHDPSYTDIVPAVCAQNRDVSDAIYTLLETAAARPDSAQSVYNLVEHWITHPPLGVEIDRWRPLLGLALQTRHTALLAAGSAAEVVAFLDKLAQASPDLHLEDSIAQFVSASHPLAYHDGRMARTLFLLALSHQPLDNLRRMFSDAQLAAQLPAALRDALTVLADIQSRQPRPGLLVKAADVYGAADRPLILGRLVEWAHADARHELLDSDTLKQLIQVMASPVGQRFDPLVGRMAAQLSDAEMLRTLPPDTAQRLLSMVIALGQYDHAVQLIQQLQEQIFKPGEQGRLSELVRHAVHETPISAAQHLAFLDVMQASELRPMVKISAVLGALTAHNFAPDMDAAARRLSQIWSGEPRMIGLKGIAPVMRLIEMFAARRDRVEVLRLTGAVIEYVLILGMDHGIDPDVSAHKIPELLGRIYVMGNWSPEMNTAILETLATYARRAPVDMARQFAAYMGMAYGEATRRAIDAANVVRQMIGGHDFAAFADHVTTAAELLIDFAATYYEGQELPSLSALRRWVQTAGSMLEQDRRQLARNMDRLARQIMQVYLIHQVRLSKRSRAEQEHVRSGLLSARAAPATALEALVWCRGYFSPGSNADIQLSREVPPAFFGSRAIHELAREVGMIVQLFDCLLNAFPERNGITHDAQAWKNEIDHVWALLPLNEQRSLQEPLGSDCGRLTAVLSIIAAKGNEKVLLDTGPGKQLLTGKQQPRSVIEALRWMSGFFSGAHG